MAGRRRMGTTKNIQPKRPNDGDFQWFQTVQSLPVGRRIAGYGHLPFCAAAHSLADGDIAGSTIPIEKMFRIIAAENDFARGLYTKDIVGAGKKVGLDFSEGWREADVAAGPLPALFLREAATSIQKPESRWDFS